METELSIQQVAKQSGLSIDTLRYYGRIGLLEPVGRAQNGHRRYTQHDLDWIDLLIRLRISVNLPDRKVRNRASCATPVSPTPSTPRLASADHARQAPVVRLCWI